MSITTVDGITPTLQEIYEAALDFHGDLGVLAMATYSEIILLEDWGLEFPADIVVRREKALGALKTLRAMADAITAVEGGGYMDKMCDHSAGTMMRAIARLNRDVS